MGGGSQSSLSGLSAGALCTDRSDLTLTQAGVWDAQDQIKLAVEEGAGFLGVLNSKH